MHLRLSDFLLRWLLLGALRRQSGRCRVPNRTKPEYIERLVQPDRHLLSVQENSQSTEEDPNAVPRMSPPALHEPRGPLVL